MRIFHTWFFFLLLSVCFAEANSSFEDIRFQNLRVEDGLSHSNVNTIFQDKDGFIWIGTNDGLNKYDGLRFEVFKHRDGDSTSIAGDVVKKIQEDRWGGLWIATTSGLSLFDRDKRSFTNFYHRDNDSTSLFNNLVLDLNYNPNTGDVIIFTDNCYYNQYFDKKSNSFKKFIPELNIYPDFLYMPWQFDRKGNAWNMTNKKIIRYNLKNKKVFQYNSILNGSNNLFPHQCFVDNNDIVWFGTDWGLIKFTPDKNTFIRYLSIKDKNNHDNPSIHFRHIINTNFISIEQDKFNFLWFGTRDGGLIKYNPDEDDFSTVIFDSENNESILSKRINCLYNDHSGIIWIGTDRGISKLNFSYQNFKLIKPSRFVHTDPNVLRMEEDHHGYIWLVKNENVKRLKLSDNSLHDVPGPLKKVFSSNTRVSISFMTKMKNGTLFMVSENKECFEVNPVNGQYKCYFINKIMPDIKDDGKITISKYRGDTILIQGHKCKYFYDVGLRNVLSNFPLKSDAFEFSNILPFGKESFWTSEYIRGIFEYSSPKKTIKTYLPFSSFNGKYNYLIVYCDYKGSDSNVYFGTKNRGLVLFDTKKRLFYSYGEKNGLLSNYINSLCEDGKQNLWMATARGLSRFSFIDKKITNYTVAHGLQDNQFNKSSILLSSNGCIYVGGIYGINYFHPDSIKKDNNPPIMAFTAFRVGNTVVLPGQGPLLEKDINQTKNITINHQFNAFSIEFAALHYAYPKLNKCSFIMEGYDKAWIEAGPGQRSVTYNNLPPGKYIFRIKGANIDDFWTDGSKKLYITILPPFWQTWWFRTGSGSLLLLFAYLFYRVQVNRIKRDRLENLVHERTQQLEQRNEEIKAINNTLEEQKDALNTLYTDLKDNIQVASLIQRSILPPDTLFKKVLPDSFVFYQPRDIVCGDFYWMEEQNNRIYLAAVDCTGHGVSGALMSMLGYNLLNQLLSSEHSEDPGEMLNRLNTELMRALRQDSGTSHTRDGMDIALCIIDSAKKELKYAGAANSLYKVKEGVLTEIKADRNSIGFSIRGEIKPYTTHTFPILNGERYFIFTDGFVGQFGGENGDEKFKYHRFRELLSLSAHLSAQEQKQLVANEYLRWKGDAEQIDDILVIGFGM